MRVFAVSDVHVDYEENARWIGRLSSVDYREDVLILAGDVTDRLPLLNWCLTTLARRFRKVLFVPGNHDLWVFRDPGRKDSFEKFADVVATVRSSGASMDAFQDADLTIVPLLGWYDYSFGEPGDELKSLWMDYRACRWPAGFDDREIAARFAAMNTESIGAGGKKIVTFSHFLPRIDLMPSFIPAEQRILYPILGSNELERQLRLAGSSIHVYGHSHVNRRVTIDGVSYINNAFGYPNEGRIASKELVCIHER